MMNQQQKLTEMLLELSAYDNFNKVCNMSLDEQTLRNLLSTDSSHVVEAQIIISRIIAITSNMSYFPIYDGDGAVVEERLCRTVFTFKNLIDILDRNFYTWDAYVHLFPNLSDVVRDYRENQFKTFKINNLTIEEQKQLSNLVKPVELNFIDTSKFNLDSHYNSRIYLDTYNNKLKSRIADSSTNCIVGEFKNFSNGLLFKELKSLANIQNDKTIIVKQRVDSGAVFYDISQHSTDVITTLAYNEFNNIVLDVAADTLTIYDELCEDYNTKDALSTVDELYSKFIGTKDEIK